jgi:hypothetical protein
MTQRFENKNEEMGRILNDSPLWKALLSDKEIRYSDFLGLFIETFKLNPVCADLSSRDYDIEVNREKKHTDLWIERIIDISEYVNNEGWDNANNALDEIGIIRLPWILIENKLKSIPFREQIELYTKKFVDEYINTVKQIFKTKHPEYRGRGKRIQLRTIENQNDEQIIILLNEIKNLKFYLISPFKSNDLDTEITVSRKIIPYNNGELKYNWEQITYPEIGKNILYILDNSRNLSVKSYLNDLFRDFAGVLDSMTLFNYALESKDFKTSIIDFFNPEDKIGFTEFNNMHSLYKKIKASQCAQELSRSLKKEISNKSVLKMKKDEILIHHDFSRNDSLFEVKKCLIEEELMIIIQFQSNELRKGIVVEDKSICKYDKWFEQEWDGIKFSPKLDKPSEHCSYRINDKMTFFYNRYDCEDETVEKILNLMALKIEDKEVLELYKLTK